MAAFEHHLSPFLIEFGGGWGIRYYGLAYAFGFLGLFFGLRWQYRLGWSRTGNGRIADFVTWMIVGVVIGGRLFYCLFYNFYATLAHPISIFEVWKGGMASHGGILGAIAAIYFFARQEKVPFYNLADATALCTPPALFFGRIANFINGELWGRPSDVPWAFIFPDDRLRLPRHPSQLYEAFLEGALLFVILLVIRLRTKSDGPVALAFVGAYGVLRIIAEFWREPDAHIGYFGGGWTQGQLISFFQILIAVVLAILLRQSRRAVPRK